MDSLINKYNKFMSYLGLICLGGFIISVLIQVISRTFLPKTKKVALIPYLERVSNA